MSVPNFSSLAGLEVAEKFLWGGGGGGGGGGFQKKILKKIFSQMDFFENNVRK